MNFLKKMGDLFLSNVAYTVILVFAVILFLYFAGGDLIGGILTALSALVVYVAIVLLYQEYKKMPKTVAKKVVAKKAKKSVKKKK